MDDPGLDPVAHRQALAGLARINAFSGSATLLWPPLRRLARTMDRPIRVLDIATGCGDVPLALHRLAKREGILISFSGCDFSPQAVEVARELLTTNHLDVDVYTSNVLADPIPPGFDAFTCSLFLHHLDEPDVVKLLGKLRDATPRLILVSDLVRNRFNYTAVWVAARLLSGSRVVHIDGPLSIRGAFTIPEMRMMADTAGLQEATVTAKFPCRMLLEWRAPS